MKKIFLLIIGVTFFCACQNQNDSLDDVKSFQPENKYFKAALMTLHFKTETSPIPEVDKSFQQIIQTYKLPTSAAGCRDGIYTGISPNDAYDYRHVAKIAIKNEKIISIEYTEIHKNGTRKDEDPQYNTAMGKGGTSPAEAYPQMEKQLLENQDIMRVDALSGATYSLYRMRYSVILALMQAQLAKR